MKKYQAVREDELALVVRRLKSGGDVDARRICRFTGMHRARVDLCLRELVKREVVTYRIGEGVSGRKCRLYRLASVKVYDGNNRDRVLAVLGDHGELGASDVNRIAELSKHSAFKVLPVLVDEGLVSYRLEPYGRWGNVRRVYRLKETTGAVL